MIYIYCVGFASLDAVCDEFNDCAWNLGLYQLSDYCVYFYCVKCFAHIECYSYCLHRGGGIWLDHFSTVLFTVCSAVTVECCFVHVDMSCGECYGVS